MRRCQNTACEGLPHGPSLKTHRIANSTDSLGALVSFHRIRWHEFGAHTLVGSLDDHHAHEMAITGGLGGIHGSHVQAQLACGTHPSHHPTTGPCMHRMIFVAPELVWPWTQGRKGRKGSTRNVWTKQHHPTSGCRQHVFWRTGHDRTIKVNWSIWSQGPRSFRHFYCWHSVMQRPFGARNASQHRRDNSVSQVSILEFFFHVSVRHVIETSRNHCHGISMKI